MTSAEETMTTTLPTTLEGFHQFADSIFEDYELPNLPSYRHAIATMIMHLDPTVIEVERSYFAKSIKKAMANQIAYDVIQTIKKEEAEKLAQEKLAQEQATNETVPNESQA
jgi:hypothetical protein